jgi:ABC-2 type transport system permease protein
MTARIVWTEIKLLTREPLTLLVSLLFPIMLLVLLVGAFGNEPDPDMGGIGGTDFYVPIYACAAIAVMGFLGIPTHLASYRESGVLQRFRAAGIPARVVLGAQAVVMTLLVLVGGGAMLIMGFTAYDLSPPESPLGVAFAFGCGLLAFTAIGVLLGSVLPTARLAQGLGLLLFFGLFFLAGGGPPPSLMPDAANTLVDYTPMGALVDAVSDPWHGRGWNSGALAGLLALTPVSALLALRRAGRA